MTIEHVGLLGVDPGDAFGVVSFFVQTEGLVEVCDTVFKVSFPALEGAEILQ